jgi:hypothetical protein
MHIADEAAEQQGEIRASRVQNIPAAKRRASESYSTYPKTSKEKESTGTSSE